MHPHSLKPAPRSPHTSVYPHFPLPTSRFPLSVSRGVHCSASLRASPSFLLAGLALLLFALPASAEGSTTPTPSELGTWLGCAAFVLVIVKTLFDFRGQRRTISPQPLQITAAINPVDIASCQKSHTDLNATLKAIDDRHSRTTESLRLEIKEDIRVGMSSLFDKIADITHADEVRIAHFHERLNPFSETVVSVRDKLNDHLEDHRSGKLK